MDIKTVSRAPTLGPSTSNNVRASDSLARTLLLYTPTPEGHALAARLVGPDALILEASTPKQAQLALRALPPDLFLCDVAAPKAELLIAATTPTLLAASTPQAETRANELLESDTVLGFIPDLQSIESMRDLLPILEATEHTDAPTTPPSPDPLRYRMISKIAEGATGEVWRARDLLLETDVALKILRSDLAADSDAIRAMKAEARIAMELSHSNLVRLYNLLQSAGRTYLVMEYIEGISLETLLQQYHTLEPILVEGVVASCANGLSYAHRHHVLHRDLKPSNLILTNDNKLKIIDFGVASLVSPIPSTENDIVGTPYYMSPEQLRGDPQGPQSDLYALGIIAYQMLSGSLPERYLFDPSHPERYHHGPLLGVPNPIRDVLEKATAYDPNDRFPSPETFSRAFSRAIHTPVLKP